ncbi:YjbH domain-containing protein [Pseudemcibacter aquimaris]|uniref:YjbH domain-containing protein n=1 Tax=Pseudemcibacter aquimaris TaxID=2857064 RepID=UPI002011DC01|nr:YjbH domain-containing protein [Pseudemcibacter aquimaris]MCC3859699.1 YjbH domain-containing protein [Pseudemcibacter aquimaris]WDU60094.1 YjbH domain-containing protein [Pseudemcibacter aquimaris]
MHKTLKYALLSSCFLPSLSNYAYAEDDGTRGVYGGAGLLEMRNARFASDGEISIGAGLIDSDKTYYANWQATPWFETTLRYTDLDNAHIDKALDIKLRILDEGDIRPAIAIGLQDLLGNGLSSGEYIVASKRISNFDITAGFGFGNLAHRAKINNIFKIFGDRFNNREFVDNGSEKLRFDDYFSGDRMGFFWGVEYNTPIKKLTAKVEYSTFDKSKTDGFEDYISKTAFNFGFNYKAKEWLEIGGGLLHGNQLSLNLTLKQNLHKPMKLGFAEGQRPDEIRTREISNSPTSSRDFKDYNDQDIIFERLNRLGFTVEKLEVNQDHLYLTLFKSGEEQVSKLMLFGALLEKYPAITLRFSDRSENRVTIYRSDTPGQRSLETFKNSSLYQREQNAGSENATLLNNEVLAGLSKRNLKPHSVEIIGNEATIVKGVGPYTELPKNIGRVGRYLTISMPDNIERYNIVTQNDGVTVSNVSVLRKDIENLAGYNGSPEEALANARFKEPNHVSAKQVKSIEYGIFPEVISHFGSTKDDHFKADVNLRAFIGFNVTQSLKLYAEGKQHLIGDLDLIPDTQSTNVPHVRSDIGKYSAEATTAIRRLNVEYTSNPLKNIYARVTAGHLEDMYSGISGEFLYSPYNASISLGIDINYVKQRDYDQLFSMRNYETVTGHANLYYINKKYDITTKLSAGRYLAKDWGATLDVAREFDNGITIGAFATVTDMSEQDFGEGSFDKGLYMVVPFDFFWFKQSREKTRFNFRRLGKNGGQKLDRNNPLFETITYGQEYKVRRDWQKFIE